MSAENLAPTGIRSPDRSSLQQVAIPVHVRSGSFHYICCVKADWSFIFIIRVHLTICKKTVVQPCPVRNVYTCAVSFIWLEVCKLAVFCFVLQDEDCWPWYGWRGRMPQIAQTGRNPAIKRVRTVMADFLDAMLVIAMNFHSENCCRLWLPFWYHLP